MKHACIDWRHLRDVCKDAYNEFMSNSGKTNAPTYWNEALHPNRSLFHLRE